MTYLDVEKVPLEKALINFLFISGVGGICYMHARLFSGFFLLVHFLTDLCTSCHAGHDFDEFLWAFFIA